MWRVAHQAILEFGIYRARCTLYFSEFDKIILFYPEIVPEGQGFMPLHHRLRWYKQKLKEGGLEVEEMVSNNSTSAPIQINFRFCGIEIKRKLTSMLCSERSNNTYNYTFTSAIVQYREWITLWLWKMSSLPSITIQRIHSWNNLTITKQWLCT